MKRVKRMVKRRNRKVNLLLVILLCIILPATAIYVGLRITEKWVSPVLNPDDNDFEFVIEEPEGTMPEIEIPDDNQSEALTPGEDETPREEASVEINPLSVYTIQIASLGNTANIDAMISQLNQSKLSYLIYKMDNSYKVFVKGSTRRRDVETELEKVREYYPDAYINELYLPKKILSYNKGDGEKIENLVIKFNGLITLMDEQAQEWYNFFVKEGELNNYSELLKKQQDILTELSSIINSTTLTLSSLTNDDIEKMIHYQESNINRSMDFIKENSAEDLYKLHSLYLDSLFRIVEVIK